MQYVLFLFNLYVSYKWRKVHLFYATNGQSQVAGRHTCQLMMKSIVEFIKKEHNITYGTFDVEATTPKDYPEALRDHVGNFYSGESLLLLSCVLLFKSRTLCALYFFEIQQEDDLERDKPRVSLHNVCK